MYGPHFPTKSQTLTRLLPDLCQVDMERPKCLETQSCLLSIRKIGKSIKYWGDGRFVLARVWVLQYLLLHRDRRRDRPLHYHL
jgi:hypothetical protein